MHNEYDYTMFIGLLFYGVIDAIAYFQVKTRYLNVVSTIEDVN